MLNVGSYNRILNTDNQVLTYKIHNQIRKNFQGELRTHFDEGFYVKYSSTFTGKIQVNGTGVALHQMHNASLQLKADDIHDRQYISVEASVCFLLLINSIHLSSRYVAGLNTK